VRAGTLLVAVALVLLAGLVWWSLGARVDVGAARAEPPEADGARPAAVLQAAAAEGLRSTPPADGEDGAAPDTDAPADAVAEPGPPPARVRGVLLDAFDQPCADTPLCLVPGAEARLLRLLEFRSIAARTGEDGAFEIPDVAPGSWLIGPLPGARRIPWAAPVVVPAGAPLVEVTLRLPPELYVAGVVVGPDGADVPKARVRGIGAGPPRYATSGPDGAFRVGPFLAGPVVVGVSYEPSGLTSRAALEVRAGDDGVVLRLVRASRLNVHVVGADGGPAPGTLIYARVDDPDDRSTWGMANVDDAGLARVTSISPGTYRVIARTPDGRAGLRTPFRIDADTDVEVTITVRAGGRLRVHASPARRSAGVHVLLDGQYADDVPRFGADGVAETGALPPGAVVVELLQANGTAETRGATIVAGQVVDVVFE
jgi:hypothetical protein